MDTKRVNQHILKVILSLTMFAVTLTPCKALSNLNELLAVVRAEYPSVFGLRAESGIYIYKLASASNVEFCCYLESELESTLSRTSSLDTLELFRNAMMERSIRYFPGDTERFALGVLSAARVFESNKNFDSDYFVGIAAFALYDQARQMYHMARTILEYEGGISEDLAEWIKYARRNKWLGDLCVIYLDKNNMSKQSIIFDGDQIEWYLETARNEGEEWGDNAERSTGRVLRSSSQYSYIRFLQACIWYADIAMQYYEMMLEKTIAYSNNRIYVDMDELLENIKIIEGSIASIGDEDGVRQTIRSMRESVQGMRKHLEGIARQRNDEWENNWRAKINRLRDSVHWFSEMADGNEPAPIVICGRVLSYISSVIDQK